MMIRIKYTLAPKFHTIFIPTYQVVGVILDLRFWIRICCIALLFHILLRMIRRWQTLNPESKIYRE